MNLSGRHRNHRFYRAASIFGLLGILPASTAMAQIIPDSTLGVEATTVIQDALIRGQEADLIDGGALRGSNLFHSFLEFNVGESQRVYFANPSGVENILSRVTGFNGSDIMGMLGVVGSANLFVLNPNGIVFGPNAQLDISGSFLASTADSFGFADGSQFSATTPQAPELLSVNVPLGVQWGPGEAGPLTNSANLAVSSGQTLALIGGDVTHTGALEAPAGRIEVLGDTISLSGTATIDVSSATGGGTVLIGGDYQGQGTIPRALRTIVGPEVSISADALTRGDGGTVIIWADDATQFYGTVLARGGSLEGNGGFVEVSSSLGLVFQGLVDATAPNGIIGTLLIDPTNITIIAGGDLIPLDSLPENGDVFIAPEVINLALANVILEATENITFVSPVNIGQAGVGLTAIAGNTIEINADIVTNGGDITLRGSDISLNNAGIGFTDLRIIPGKITLVATGEAVGSNGDIRLSEGLVASNTNINGRNAFDVELSATGNILLTNASQVTASTNSTGNGGTIIINNPRGVVRIENDSLISSSSGASVTDTTQSGGIAVTTDRLIVEDEGKIQSITFGVGTGGSIDINAHEIDVVGEISASTLGSSATGSGGTVELSANFIRVNEGFVGAQSDILSSGDAGEVAINVGQLTIDGQGRISAEAQGSGSAGNLTIISSGDVEIKTDESVTEPVSRLTVSSETGRAGTLTLRARSVTLDNGRIEARTEALDDESGNIEIYISGTLLRLDGGSPITAEAAEGSDGGNVIIEIPNGFLLARPGSNSDILASANRGAGGNIRVVTDAIFGIEERNPTTGFSDFNASSAVNVDGTVLLITLGIDPSRGLAELPVDVIDVAGLVATGCVGDNRSGVEDQGEFSITGRGGIAQSPAEALASPGGVANLATLDEDHGVSDRTSSPISPTDFPERLREAQGLAVDLEGNVTIAATGTTESMAPAAVAALNCDAF